MESGLCMFNDHMQMDLRAGVTTIMLLFWSAVVGVIWSKYTTRELYWTDWTIWTYWTCPLAFMSLSTFFILYS